jgi:hypothetical protein
VELDVFSGRRNPTWTLETEESQDLLAMISRLPPGDEIVPTGLGYRGFIVYRTVMGRPQRWLHVGRGMVRMADNHQIRHYRDSEGIEQWLRRQAISRGYGALIDTAPQ